MILRLTGLTRWYGELHVGILLELYLRTLTTRSRYVRPVVVCLDGSESYRWVCLVSPVGYLFSTEQ